MQRSAGVAWSGGLAAGVLAAATLVGVRDLHRLRQIPRLPETAVELDRLVRPAVGMAAAEGRPVGVTVLGDSLVAGVGVPVAEASLPVRLAALVADELQRPVRLRVHGRTGARASDVLHEQLPRLASGPRPDVVVVSVGVNDATRLARPGGHARILRGIVDELHQRLGVEVVLCGLPDVRAFRALSPSVRAVVRVHAERLHRAQRRVAEATGAAFVPRVPSVAAAFAGQPLLMAGDRFHPSPVGATVLAALAAPTVARALGGLPPPRVSVPGRDRPGPPRPGRRGRSVVPRPRRR